jgi:hypothetical protein
MVQPFTSYKHRHIITDHLFQVPNVMDGVPTYRQFQFEDSLEGTEVSLARYRSNYPTMGTAGTLMTNMNTAASLGTRAGVR